MISKSVIETAEIAREFAANLQPRKDAATIVALSGDLGAGKTTFTKAFAAALGLDADDVTSPTFVIEKRFNLNAHVHFDRLIHIDAYRLEKPEEIERLGWKETLTDPKNLILIEWPENIGGALPENSASVSFKFIDENTREIVFN